MIDSMNKTMFFAILLAIVFVVCVAFFINVGDISETAPVEKKTTTQSQSPVKKAAPVLKAKKTDKADRSKDSIKQNSTSVPVSEHISDPEIKEIDEVFEADTDAIDEVDEDENESYPLEDAEIYFVPKEQRYPGNIGGPPPLNLVNPEIESAN